MRINKKVQDFYEILEEEIAKKRTAKEKMDREIELLPEAYVSNVSSIPVVEATLVEQMPVAVVIEDELNTF